MSTPDPIAATCRDYDARAQDYADYVADPTNHPALTRPFILAFAHLVAALPGAPGVLDVGCGPGLWTAALRDGYLLLGFQSGGPEAWTSFEHGVTRAFAWSIDAMAAHTAAHDFTEVGRLIIAPRPGKRLSNGYLLVQREGSCPAGS